MAFPSAFITPDIKLGGNTSQVVIDLSKQNIERTEMLKLLKDYFENPEFKKVFYNFCIDFHMMCNENINV